MLAKQRGELPRHLVWVIACVVLSSASCYSRPESQPLPRKKAMSAGHTTIHTPRRLTHVEVTTASGVDWIPCQTCHSLRASKPLPTSMASLKEFHVGKRFEHGKLKCAACHSEGQPPRLRLADGTRLEMAEAMQLCGQCHGQQLKNYEQGLHGGMQGYWDTTRGDRQKNHCVDCHDPHQPAFDQVQPKQPPRDRFLNGDDP
jgi:hypothetical protein